MNGREDHLLFQREVRLERIAQTCRGDPPRVQVAVAEYIGEVPVERSELTVLGGDAPGAVAQTPLEARLLSRVRLM